MYNEKALNRVLCADNTQAVIALDDIAHIKDILPINRKEDHRKSTMIFEYHKRYAFETIIKGYGSDILPLPFNKILDIIEFEMIEKIDLNE